MGEFVEGDLVEVCSKEDGYFGSYFEAKVLSKLPHGSFYEVEYKNLITEGENPRPLIETISADEICPMPPASSQPSMFSLHAKVDAFDLDAFTFPQPIICVSTQFKALDDILHGQWIRSSMSTRRR